MRRFILSSPASLLTFIFGIFAVFSPADNLNAIKRPTDRPNRFEVQLDVIQVRDSDPSNWIMNDGYLSLYASVFLEENKILSLYLQDGFRISHDGGHSWKRMFEPTGIPSATLGYTLQSLEFIDSRTGWASGSCLIATHDGGETWERLELPEWMDNIRVKFQTPSIGYAAGRAGFCNRDRSRCNTSLAVYKTIDGGKKWKLSFRDRKLTIPWDIIAIDENVAMMIGDGRRLFRTQNAGKSWKIVLQQDHGSMSISTSPNGRFWLFGTNSIRFSDDLGLTWQQATHIDESIVNNEWWSVDFTRDGIGVAVSEEAAIAITRDGGQSWKQVQSNLHINGKIPVANNPFDEQLRSIRLNRNIGIINGSQRDYLLTIHDLR